MAINVNHTTKAQCMKISLNFGIWFDVRQGKTTLIDFSAEIPKTVLKICQRSRKHKNQVFFTLPWVYLVLQGLDWGLVEDEFWLILWFKRAFFQTLRKQFQLKSCTLLNLKNESITGISSKMRSLDLVYTPNSN